MTTKPAATAGLLDLWRARAAARAASSAAVSPLAADGKTFWLTHYADFGGAAAQAAAEIARSDNPVCIVLDVDDGFPFLDSLRARARAAVPNAQWLEVPYATAADLIQSAADDDDSAPPPDNAVQRTWEEVKDVFGD